MEVLMLFLQIWDWTKHSKVLQDSKITNDDSISPCHEWNKNEKNERMNERKNETTQIWEELKLFLEEADTQIIPRFSYSILNGYKRIVVIKWHRSLCTDSSLYVSVLRQGNKWTVVKILHWYLYVNTSSAYYV